MILIILVEIIFSELLRISIQKYVFKTWHTIWDVVKSVLTLFCNDLSFFSNVTVLFIFISTPRSFSQCWGGWWFQIFSSSHNAYTVLAPSDLSVNFPACRSAQQLFPVLVCFHICLLHIWRSIYLHFMGFPVLTSSADSLLCRTSLIAIIMQVLQCLLFSFCPRDFDFAVFTALFNIMSILNKFKYVTAAANSFLIYITLENIIC